jgi:hypothetical protein
VYFLANSSAFTTDWLLEFGDIPAGKQFINTPKRVRSEFLPSLSHRMILPDQRSAKKTLQGMISMP